MVIGEVFVSKEMIAAGLESLAECRRDCLTDGDTVIDIYLAMEGMKLKCICEGQESTQ